MKPLRRFVALSVLALVFAVSTSAGDMQAGITAPPPPPETTISGEISTGYVGDMTTGLTANNSVTEIALSVLQSLLGLF